jgi:ABC-type cobalamin/Fe3+-siderophores transport system ATPase subunit
LQAALAKEQEIKKRFLPQWKTWATNYPVVRDAAASLLVKKDAKQIELKEYSKAIFTTHQKRINDLLLDLGADFAITGLTGKTDERANESYSDFAFLILEQAVPLTARQDDAPCFKNTLSEGDKSTLAFAFFIAVLEGLPELAKQVVVFDDPLSSLDENRREATARLLMKLSRTVNQVAVFTHKKDFLRMLYEKMPAAKVLQLCSDKKNGSRIMALDMEEDLKGEHARMLEGMERYCNEDFGPSTEIMQGNIRKAFEVVLKTKYYRALAQEIKEKKGFGTLLTKLFNDNVLDPSLKQDLFDLCNVTNGPHHGEIVDATSKTLTREELIPLIQRSFKLMEKV